MDPVTVIAYGLVGLLAVLVLATVLTMLWHGFDWPGADRLLGLWMQLMTLVLAVGAVLALVGSMAAAAAAAWALWRAGQPQMHDLATRLAHAGGSLAMAVFSVLLFRKGWGVLQGMRRNDPTPTSLPKP